MCITLHCLTGLLANTLFLLQESIYAETPNIFEHLYLKKKININIKCKIRSLCKAEKSQSVVGSLKGQKVNSILTFTRQEKNFLIPSATPT